MGRTPATTDEWTRYYERADRLRKRYGDPFERLIRRGRMRELGVQTFVWAQCVLVCRQQLSFWHSGCLVSRDRVRSGRGRIRG